MGLDVSVWVFDVFAALILSATALIGAYMPVILSRKGKVTGERSISFILGNMLSAGVMISAGFCHLLGDAIEQLTRSITYPLAPFLCACGFMATLIADQVVEGATEQHRQPIPVLADGELAILNSLAGGSSSTTPREHTCFGGALQLAGGGGGDSSIGADKPHHRRQSSGASPLANGDADSNAEAGIIFGDEDSSGSRRQERGGLLTQQQKLQSSDHSGHHLRTGSDAGSDRGGAMTPEEKASGRAQVSFFTACLMGVALTFHSLLEGAALGAQGDVVNSLHIFIAIQAHKGLAAYALGSSIVDSDAQARQFWSVIMTFAFATPVGIGFGFVLSSVTTSNGAAAISALASGTFLYVAFMEVLPRELNDPSHRLAKLGMLTLGFGLMSLLAIWA